MANLNPTAIRTAIAERLDGTLTSTARAITAGIISGDLVVGADDVTTALRTATLPRFTVSLAFSKHPDRPMGPGPAWIDLLTVRIRTHYLLTTQVLARVDYDAVRAASELIGYKIRAALEMPNSVLVTSAAVATGIVDGWLAHQSSEVVTDQPPQPGQDGGGLYVTEHTFTGAVFTVATV